MNIDQITQQVIERIKQDYYLHERIIIKLNNKTVDRNEYCRLFVLLAIQSVAKYYGMEPKDIMSAKRGRIKQSEFTVTALRSMVSTICQTESKILITHEYIGAAFAKDHSTITYYKKIFADMFVTYKSFRTDYANILADFKTKVR